MDGTSSRLVVLSCTLQSYRTVLVVLVPLLSLFRSMARDDEITDIDHRLWPKAMTQGWTIKTLSSGKYQYIAPDGTRMTSRAAALEHQESMAPASSHAGSSSKSLCVRSASEMPTPPIEDAQRSLAPWWIKNRVVEVTMVEEGLIGSQYEAEVISANPGGVFVRFAYFVEEDGKDEPLCETVDVSRLSPKPPPSPKDFFQVLKVRAPTCPIGTLLSRSAGCACVACSSFQAACRWLGTGWGSAAVLF